MVNMTTISDALKNVYLNPMRDDINTGADAFASRILKTSDHVVGYKKIIRAAQIGVNGGAGAGSETGALPSAGENLYTQIESDTKNLYGVLQISDKIMKSATGNNAGSFINALEREINGLLKTCKWNLARQIYGDGTGKLMVAKTNGTPATVIEAASGQTVKNILPGLKVDLRDDATASIYSNKGGMRVLDVDRKTNKITLDTSTAIVASDFFTIQGSYNYELTGFGKLFETISGSETLYGKTRSSYSWLRPYLNASFGSISEKGIQQVIDLLEDSYNISINHINMGNTAYGYYMDLLNSRRAINDVMTLEGGHTALKFNNMPVVRNKFLDAAEIQLLDTSIFSIDQIADWDWIEGPTRSVLTQVAGYPYYTASLTKYCDLMCALPAAMAKLTGVTAAA